MLSLSVIVIPPFPMFSHGNLFQLNCIPSMMQLTHPQSTRQRRAGHCHPTLVSHVERRMLVSFPVLFISPSAFETFSHSFFFSIKLISWPPCRPPPLSEKANKSPSLPSPLVCHMEEALMVSSSLIFSFSPPIQHFFSQLPFSI